MEPQKIKDSIQAVIDGLTPLAEKLQKPVEELWRMFILENYVKAIWGIVSFIIATILTLIVTNIIKKKIKKNKMSWQDITDHFPLTIGIIFCLISYIILSILFLVEGQTIVSRFINPEYNVLKDIFEMLNPDCDNIN
jgi:hypothetical protein